MLPLCSSQDICQSPDLIFSIALKVLICSKSLLVMILTGILNSNSSLDPYQPPYLYPLPGIKEYLS